MDGFSRQRKQELRQMLKRGAFTFGRILFHSDARLAVLQDSQQETLSLEERCRILQQENDELKNQLKGQDYICAINQYKNDRSAKEFAFRMNHRFLVYFAVDLYEVWMTTQLADGDTRFMPFNRGSNGAGVSGGAGNPPNPNGYVTAYLWEEVLQRDSLLDLLQRFISYVKEKEEVVKNGVVRTVTKEKMIFPRYHQYDVVRKVLADVKQSGPGKNYLHRGK